MSALTGDHSFNLSTDFCNKCGCNFQDWISGKDPKCNPQTQNCCNKPGRDRWNPGRVHWECSSCGLVKSNDPNYLYWRSSVTRPFTPDFGDPDTDISDLRNEGKTCSHRWKQYHGLKDSFEFCEVCDQKR